MNEKKYQIGSSTATTVTYAAIMEINPSESRTIVTTALTGAGTLNLGADAKPQIGDELILKVSSDATARDLTLGTGITGPVLAGTINKTKVQSFVYDGTAFIAAGALIQID